MAIPNHTKSVPSGTLANFLSGKIIEVLFGENKSRIKVEIHTDSEPLIESIRSTKRVENKYLCQEVGAMKEALLREGPFSR